MLGILDSFVCACLLSTKYSFGEPERATAIPPSVDSLDKAAVRMTMAESRVK